MNYNSFFNFLKSDTSKFGSSDIPSPGITSLEELSDKQTTAVNDVLVFLRAQSDTANKQFRTSRNLICSTIVIMILQIVIAGFSIGLSNSEQTNLTKIIETQSVQSETISQMSLHLLDLQAQVQTLEKEKQELLKK